MNRFTIWLIVGELFVAYVATGTREYHDNYRHLSAKIGQHSRRSALIGLSLVAALQCLLWPIFMTLFIMRRKPK